MAQVTFAVDETPFAHLSLNESSGTVTETEADINHYLLIDTDSRFFVAASLVKNAELFREFFAEITKTVILSFRNIKSFESFNKWLEAFFAPSTETPAFQVAMFVFDDWYKYGGLAIYPRREQHGKEERAHNEFSDWLDVACSLPSNVEIELVFRVPWRDFHWLHHESQSLRNRGTFKVGVAVDGWQE